MNDTMTPEQMMSCEWKNVKIEEKLLQWQIIKKGAKIEDKEMIKSVTMILDVFKSSNNNKMHKCIARCYLTH